jgi:hypothetical protein
VTSPRSRNRSPKRNAIRHEAEWLNAARYEVAMLERDFDGAARFLARTSKKGLEDVVRPSFLPHQKAFHEGLLAAAIGGEWPETARILQTARDATAAEGSSEEGDAEAARPRSLMDLAIVDAFLRRKEDAIRGAREALGTAIYASDSIERRDLSAGLALVYAQTGEPEKALDLIEHLLTVPMELQRGAVYNMTVVDLKWRWIWDPLREHPRFQQLLAGLEPKTIY